MQQQKMMMKKTKQHEALWTTRDRRGLANSSSGLRESSKRECTINSEESENTAEFGSAGNGLHELVSVFPQSATQHNTTQHDDIQNSDVRNEQYSTALVLCFGDAFDLSEELELGRSIARQSRQHSAATKSSRDPSIRRHCELNGLAFEFMRVIISHAINKHCSATPTVMF